MSTNLGAPRKPPAPLSADLDQPISADLIDFLCSVSTPAKSPEGASTPSASPSAGCSHASTMIAALLDHVLGGWRRQHPERLDTIRLPLSLPIDVVPVNQGASPLASACTMTLVEVSAQGASFLGRTISDSDHVLIDFGASGIVRSRLLATVTSRSDFQGYARYECDFVADAGES